MIQYGLRLHDAEKLPLQQQLSVVRDMGFTCVHLALSMVQGMTADPSALTPGYAMYLKKAFEKAEETLLGLPDGEYADLLAKLAAGSAKSGRGEIILNSRDRDRVGADVVKKANQLLQGRGELTLADDVGEMEGGLVLRSGKVEVNCAFETQLRILRDTMAAEVAKVLFP